MIHVTCCGLLRDAINNDLYPFTYDERIQEVQLLLTVDDRVAVVRFCPFCGEKLESGRSKLFTEPTDDECEDVWRKLEGLATLDEVIAKLGEPDDRGIGNGTASDRWREWIVYREIWDSLMIIIGEHEDGTVSCTISGQPVDRETSE